MYPSLLIPWSPHPSAAETAYRGAGLVKTKGTIFLLPPSLDILRSTYSTPPRPQTRMSSGAVALCKHFERGGYSSDASKGRALHPFWKVPVGSNENKSAIAEELLDSMLDEAVWRNVMLLHAGVAVYEVRNQRGYGMRWTLEIEEGGREGGEEEEWVGQENGDDDVKHEEDARSPNQGGKYSNITEQGATKDNAKGNWRIVQTTFRGFLEPIEGLDHELDGA